MVGLLRANSGQATLLERDLPFVELSLIAEADRRSRDPAYAGHSWFARRPPGAMRGLLLAAALPDDTTRDDYWASFASAEPALSGLRAHDPFAGGGTILVEAARLGAVPSGTDVDPLAGGHGISPSCVVGATGSRDDSVGHDRPGPGE